MPLPSDVPPAFIQKSRNIQADIERLAGSQVFAAPGAELAISGSAGGPLLMNPDGSIDPTSLSSAVGSASRVAAIALSLVGSPNREYFIDVRHACASFVSTVLQQAGVFSAGEFTRAANDIPSYLLRHGAVPIVPRNTRLADARALGQLVPGDVLCFHRTGDLYHHTGIMVDQASFVSTSNSAEEVINGRRVRGIVERTRLATYPSYGYYAAWRLP